MQEETDNSKKVEDTLSAKTDTQAKDKVITKTGSWFEKISHGPLLISEIQCPFMSIKI